jgi:hypothetical protein
MWGKEPAVFFNGLAEVIRAIIPVLILFGFIQWTDEQIAGVMLLVGVVVGFLITMLTRSQVVSVDKANAQIETALRLSPSTTVAEVIAKTEANQ